MFRNTSFSFARLVGVDLTGTTRCHRQQWRKADFLGNSTPRRAITATCMSMKYSGSRIFRSCAKVASGMASQKHLRSTLFDTFRWRTALTLLVWRAVQQGARQCRCSHRNRHQSQRRSPVGCPADGQWRRIVTQRDALAGEKHCSTSTSSDAKTVMRTLEPVYVRVCRR